MTTRARNVLEVDSPVHPKVLPHGIPTHMSTTFTPRTMRVPYFIVELLKHFIRHDVRRHLLPKKRNKYGRKLENKSEGRLELRIWVWRMPVTSKGKDQNDRIGSLSWSQMVTRKPAKCGTPKERKWSSEHMFLSCVGCSSDGIINKFNLNLNRKRVETENEDFKKFEGVLFSAPLTPRYVIQSSNDSVSICQAKPRKAA